ncbi:hypothetical protein [Rhizobium sp. BK176]|uniref:hypothetical protein n=1 Tax=Rhizobium sp. BK176 TaxID=2587071 RepID=UPI002167BDF2|nr:hypothetical protein [Rhizobium sp. BK176]MCS4089381.1 hypothetical protein [Rhizobium sp. BK176]
MEGPYFIEHGDVWSYTTQPGRPSYVGPNSRHVCDGTEELAIALVGDTMMKHGSAKSVDAWAEKKASGFDVTIIRFPVSPETVEELNKCATNTTRAASIVARLEDIGKSRPELASLPRFPR